MGDKTQGGRSKKNLGKTNEKRWGGAEAENREKPKKKARKTGNETTWTEVADWVVDSES